MEKLMLLREIEIDPILHGNSGIEVELLPVDIKISRVTIISILSQTQLSCETQ